MQKTGVSPKQLCDVIRFRDLKAALSGKPFESLMTLAWDHGYTDHSHLTKTFKAFAGVTPSEFIKSL